MVVIKLQGWLDVTRTQVTVLFLIFFSLLSYAMLYEHYPRVGWMDAAIYTGFATVENAYKHIDNAWLSVNGATYQHSRLGYIAPLRALSASVGEIKGRLAFNFIIFLHYCVASIQLCSHLLAPKKCRSLALLLLLFNPALIISLVSGGADGVAAIYSYLSLTVLYFAVIKRRKLYYFLAGVCFALALSTHVFSAMPYVIALVPLFLLTLAELPTFSVCLNFTKGWKASLFGAFGCYLLGLASVICTINYWGHSLGLKKFYLLYSFEHATYSLAGSGNKFSQPLDFGVLNAALWIGVVPFIFIALSLLSACSVGAAAFRVKVRCLAAILGLVLPLFFVFFYDFVIGGSILYSPHYFGLFFPCFAIGLIALFAGASRANSTAGLVVALSLATTFHFLSAIFPPNNRAALSFWGINSRNLYASQIEFKDAALLLAESANFNIIYSNLSPGGGGAYFDYFEGRARIFNYLDTLVNTFSWSGDKTYKITSKSDTGFLFRLEPALPTLVLASTSAELNRVFDIIRKSGGHLIVNSTQCRGAGAYTWCLASIQYDK